jgi:hypothetical protein
LEETTILRATCINRPTSQRIEKGGQQKTEQAFPETANVYEILDGIPDLQETYMKPAYHL